MADCARDQLVDLDRLLTNVQLMVACICFCVFMEFFIACFGDCLFGLGCFMIFHCSNCLFSTEADTVTYLNLQFTAQEKGEARRMTRTLTPPRVSPPRHLRRRRERSRSR